MSVSACAAGCSRHVCPVCARGCLDAYCIYLLSGRCPCELNMSYVPMTLRILNLLVSHDLPPSLALELESHRHCLVSTDHCPEQSLLVLFARHPNSMTTSH